MLEFKIVVRWLCGFAFIFIMSFLCRPTRKKENVKGKNILITGAAMGIGKELAFCCALHQCSKLVLWDIKGDLLDSVVEMIKSSAMSKQITIIPVQCDISSRESIDKATTFTLAMVGSIDVLINNAGIVTGKQFVDLSDLSIEQTIGVNVLGTIYTTKRFLPAMIKRKSGHIVNISSLMGLMVGVGLTDYCSSKYAIVGFSKSLRLELKRLTRGLVKTTLICPFAVDTGMFSGIRTSFQWLFPLLKPKDVAQRIIEAIENEEEFVVIPPLIGFILRILPILPLWLQDLIGEMCGSMNGMDSFIGHPQQT